jgi:hypothetical protein
VSFPRWAQDIALFKATEIQQGEYCRFGSVEMFLPTEDRSMFQERDKSAREVVCHSGTLVLDQVNPSDMFTQAVNDLMDFLNGRNFLILLIEIISCLFRGQTFFLLRDQEPLSVC